MHNNSKPVWQSLGLGAVAGVRASAAPKIANYYSNGYKSSSFGIIRLVQSPITTIATSLLSAAEKERKRNTVAGDKLDLNQLGLHVASGAFAGAAIFRKNKQSMFKGMLIGGAAALATGIAGYYLRKHAAKLPDVVNHITDAFNDSFAYSSGVKLMGK
ncbi:hypothetical protein [Mucilaginibacter phyllosphaerae]|uniref:Membrane protein n=1 Tax=Mucilaginibacter phyllosphaerae TaxID=1812349 RepID=A0A4Y8AFH8_9SPHI|nr:hypothetical protein [Mucilaginibacter phyllosphaerae]MBB3968833.1 putative membrane protein [Mucilaginibacter phyllosphaerae]TEW67536.1 hypothetical protein E2R65_05975 [Mucilaginibacter phyllosphaerae]GGH13629.1 hypothetical protein GCM10007352_21180 [Mucilaginibacter phyllosphaerae]